jgi:hypothetical protein
MGFNVQLIAVSGKAPHQVQAEYGVVPTAEYTEVPDSPVVGALLPGGAYLLFINDRVLPHEHDFSRLSHRGSLVAFYVYEGVGDSYATAWKNGNELWTVYWDGQRHRLHTSGQLPVDYESISAPPLAQQKKDDCSDIFEIPVELFVAHGGIRYNQDPPGAGPKPWEILTRRRSRV